MADTRPPARGAGSARRGLLAAAALAALGACSSTPPAPPVGGLLTPTGSYVGGRLAGDAGASAAGGPFRGFVSPVAVAAHGADLFVADAGLDATFLLDTATLTLRRLGSLRAHPGLRLQPAGDATLYALDPLRRELLHLGRDGRVLERLQDPALLSGAADFARDETDGRILVLDRGQNRIVAVSRTLVASAQLLLPRGRDLEAPWTLAAAPGQTLVVADRARRQLVLLDRDARLLQAFGADALRLPGRVAVDRHRRVFVHDAADNALHVFLNGARIATLPARELGVAAIADFAVDDAQLALVAPGPAVRTFRISAPRVPQ